MKRIHLLQTTAVLWLAAWVTAVSAATWTGANGNDWFDAGNWDPAGVPGADSEVSVAAGADILLTNETAALASFTMDGGTLTFSNWTTRLQADMVTIQGGTLTLPPAFTEAQMSNRVWIVCQDFTLADGAEIDAQGRGYVAEQGEGKGDGRGGAGHGGLGGAGSTTPWGYLGKVYGNPAVPKAPGSGGAESGYGGSGGGAVWINASGAVTMDGTITVRGNNGSSNGGAGSGGSILIESQTFHGATSGLLNAAGGNAFVHGGRAGGGRIAVIYDVTAQGALAEPNPPVRFRAAPGTGGSGLGAYTVRPGTLYLQDDRFLTANMTADRWMNVVIVIPNFETWTPPSLTLGGKIGFMDLESVSMEGDLTITNGGTLTLFGTPSHPDVTGAGQFLEVGGTLSIQDTARLELFSDDLSGVAPYVECGSLIVEDGGTISGDWYGYGVDRGPGAGSGRDGAGYGGRGSDYPDSGIPYGVAHAPVFAGSGGGGANDGGGRGGGCVRVGVRGAMRMDGEIRASGMNYLKGNGGGGSGGGILLAAQSFEGSGALTADAGSGNYGSGGGRIAVWTPFLPYAGMNSLAEQDSPPNAVEELEPEEWNGWTGTTSVASTGSGTTGTVFFGRLVFGTLLMVR